MVRQWLSTSLGLVLALAVLGGLLLASPRARSGSSETLPGLHPAGDRQAGDTMHTLLDAGPPGATGLPLVASRIADSGWLTAQTGQLVVLDLSQPVAPTVVGTSAPLRGLPRRIVVADGHAYVATFAGGVHVVDVRDPTHPRLQASIGEWPAVLAVAVAPPHAYLATGQDGLQILDVSDPSQPTVSATYSLPHGATQVQVTEDHVHVGDSGNVIHVLDRRHPTALQEIGSYHSKGSPDDVLVLGGHREPKAQRSTYATASATHSASASVDGRSGWALELFELDGTTLPVWQWPDLLEGGMGLRFVDVDDPTAPHRIGRSVLRADALGMAAAHGHAYVAAGPCGLRTLDLADPIRPREVASEPGHAQDVTVSGRYGYVLMAATSLIPGCTSGPDASGPRAP